MCVDAGYHMSTQDVARWKFDANRVRMLCGLCEFLCFVFLPCIKFAPMCTHSMCDFHAPCYTASVVSRSRVTPPPPVLKQAWSWVPCVAMSCTSVHPPPPRILHLPLLCALSVSRPPPTVPNLDAPFIRVGRHSLARPKISWAKLPRLILPPVPLRLILQLHPCPPPPPRWAPLAQPTKGMGREGMV